jgi:hypothetical protein
VNSTSSRDTEPSRAALLLMTNKDFMALLLGI